LDQSLTPLAASHRPIIRIATPPKIPICFSPPESYFKVVHSQGEEKMRASILDRFAADRKSYNTPALDSPFGNMMHGEQTETKVAPRDDRADRQSYSRPAPRFILDGE